MKDIQQNISDAHTFEYHYTPFAKENEQLQRIVTPNQDFSLAVQAQNALESDSEDQRNWGIEALKDLLKPIVLDGEAPNEIFPTRSQYLNVLESVYSHLKNSFLSSQKDVIQAQGWSNQRFRSNRANTDSGEDEVTRHTLSGGTSMNLKAQIDTDTDEGLLKRISEALIVEMGFHNGIHNIRIDDAHQVDLSDSQLSQAQSIVEFYQDHIETSQSQSGELQKSIGSIKAPLQIRRSIRIIDSVIQLGETARQVPESLEALQDTINELCSLAVELDSNENKSLPLLRIIKEALTLKEYLIGTGGLTNQDISWFNYIEASLYVPTPQSHGEETSEAIFESAPQLRKLPVETNLPLTPQTLRAIISKSEAGQALTHNEESAVALICNEQQTANHSRLSEIMADQSLSAEEKAAKLEKVAQNIITIEEQIRSKYAPSIDENPCEKTIAYARKIIRRQQAIENYRTMDHEKIWKVVSQQIQNNFTAIKPAAIDKINDIFQLKAKNEDLSPEDEAKVKIIKSLQETLTLINKSSANVETSFYSPAQSFLFDNFAELQLLGLDRDVSAKAEISIVTPYQSLDYEQNMISSIHPLNLMPGNVIALKNIDQHTYFIEVTDKTVPHFDPETNVLTNYPVFKLPSGDEFILATEYEIGQNFTFYRVPSNISDPLSFGGSINSLIDIEVYKDNTSPAIKKTKDHNKYIDTLRRAYREKLTVQKKVDSESEKAAKTKYHELKAMAQDERAFTHFINTERQNNKSFDAWWKSKLQLEKMLTDENIFF